MANIEDFKKLEFKVGKVLEVADHPNADRLYVVKVDLGETQRQVVAGIKNSYAKEALIGKQVIIVTNLDPAVLRGVESQGMILAATDDTGLAVVTTDKPMKLGSIVK
ncbi:MAG: methionine--tRNA ligase subunit beta [Candidatus Omnitrophota bacterium]